MWSDMNLNDSIFKTVPQILAFMNVVDQKGFDHKNIPSTINIPGLSPATASLFSPSCPTFPRVTYHLCYLLFIPQPTALWLSAPSLHENCFY